jgi:DNA gyrase subunit A
MVVEDDKDYMIFATSKGNVRRNSVQDFYNIPSNGKIAIGLEEGDKLVGVQVCKAQSHIFLATQKGKAIRFPVMKIRVFKGRSSSGVRGIKLNDDMVVSLAILKGITITNDERDSYLKINLDKRQLLVEKPHDEAMILANKLINKLEGQNFTPERLLELSRDEEFLLTVMNRGYGKCSSSYSYRITGRGGQGVINANLKKYTGEVMTTFPLTLNDDLVVVTKNAITIRIAAEEIRVSGRSSSGVRLINLHDDDLITSVSRILEDKEEDFVEENE